MKKEIENYYKTNFGSFRNITAAAIASKFSNDSWLADLPASISFTTKKSGTAKKKANKYLHAKIKKAFKLIQN